MTTAEAASGCSAPSPLAGRALSFEWREVDCFLRPQVLACDALAPSYGSLFLFLASQQRAANLRRALPDSRHHGGHSHGVFCRLTGVDFEIHSPGSQDQLLPCVKRVLPDGPVIVPVAPWCLPYASYARPKADLHHVIVSAFEGRTGTFVVVDNIAFHHDPKSVAYDETSLPEETLDLAARKAWTGPFPSWILQIKRTWSSAPLSERAVMHMILTEYRHRACLDLPGQVFPLEELNLRALEEKSRARMARDLPALVRGYLADCNLSGVHLRIAAQVLQRLGATQELDLPRVIDEHLDRLRAIRANFLANYMSLAVNKQDWSDLRSHLSDMGGRARSCLTFAIDSLEPEG